MERKVPPAEREAELRAVENLVTDGLKESTAKIYAMRLRVFARDYGWTITEMTEQPLEAVEDAMADYVARNRKLRPEDAMAPKVLNIVYNAVKTILVVRKVIKNRAQFRQIRFDKQHRKTRDTTMFTKPILKQLFDAAALDEKVVSGLFMHGLRPSIIPQLTVKHIDSRDITKDPATGEIKLRRRYTWIWVYRELSGNKAGIDFPIILTQELCEWVENWLNQSKSEKLTPVTNYRQIKRILFKLRHKIGFAGRPYLLRHYANKAYKELGDVDLKEWLMGHKGTISAVYDHEHYITDQERERYNASFAKCEGELTVYAPELSVVKQAQIEMLLNQLKGLGVNIDSITTAKEYREAESKGEEIPYLTIKVRESTLQWFKESTERPTLKELTDDRNVRDCHYELIDETKLIELLNRGTIGKEDIVKEVNGKTLVHIRD